MKIKTLLNWLIFVVGILCLLDVGLLLIKGIALHVGTLSLFVIGIAFVLFGYLKLFKKIRIIKNRTLSKIITVCIVLMLCSFVAVETIIWTGSQDESNQKVDFVILLGAGLQGDIIPETLRNRIDKCVTYLQTNPEAKLVASGGQGIGETITEAAAMKRYLEENGISDDRIYAENQATSTYENLLYSKKILDQTFGSSDYTVMIATNDFHMFRAKMLAERLGLVAYGMPARTWWGSFPSNCIREYFAVVKSFFM
jgi:uncharacterized SAM-binding protein YcdF (DUF218 family)